MARATAVVPPSASMMSDTLSMRKSYAHSVSHASGNAHFVFDDWSPFDDGYAMRDSQSILAALDEKGIQRGEVARALNISQPNATRLYQPDSRTGKTRSLTYDEGQLLIDRFKLFRDEPPSARPAEQQPTYQVDGGEVAELGRLDLSLPMGPGASVDDYVEEEPVLFDLGYLRVFTRTPASRLKLARGVGDSMSPTILPNDEVLIDTTQNTLLHSDRVYAASINGGAAIKRLRPIEGGKRILVISDNKTIDPYPVDASEVRIWGRVIRFARDL